MTHDIHPRLQDWHCQCLLCGHRYYDSITVVHNAGYDWADTSSYCPACHLPNEGSSEYRMIEGRIPCRHGAGYRCAQCTIQTPAGERHDERELCS